VSEENNSLLDDFSVTLEYSVKEINSILSLLAQLPYIQVIGVINSIHHQVGPQFQKAKTSLDAVLKTAKKEGKDEPKATS
jgi:hypothetical protein